MAVWSTKRRFTYGGSFILVAVLVIGGIFWKIIYKAPTCSDGRQNGDEKGIDCGGSCKNLCTSDALSPVILWAKIFNISGDVYSAVAYVQNPNINSKNPSAHYKFNIYDTQNHVIATKEGDASIPKNKKFAVFETGLVFSGAKPKSADFQFTSFSNWEKDAQSDDGISVDYGTVTSTSTTPRLNGTIKNTSIRNISQIEITAFVLDKNENVIGASHTFVDNLVKGTSQDFVFTWQKPFDGDISLINVMYRSL